MTAYVAWLLPVLVAVILILLTRRSRQSTPTGHDDHFNRLVWLLLASLACMLGLLWLVLDALSEPSLHVFTLPAVVSLLMISGFAAFRILR